MNRHHAAAVLSASGGQLGIFDVISLFFLPGSSCFALLQLKKSGRLDVNSVPTLQNGSPITDFCFDPFDPSRVVVGKLGL